VKVGVITIQKCDNFGADLQAYALQRKLQLMGYDAENIDYLFYKHPRHQGGRGEKTFLSFKFVFRTTLVYWVKKLGWFYLRHRQ